MKLARALDNLEAITQNRYDTIRKASFLFICLIQAAETSAAEPSGKTTVMMMAHKANFGAFPASIASPCAADGTSPAAEASS
ncbi:hypothetical protein T01_1839 [Trichinella spiralis]|uniref:Uncharacterized protein n=1 Tax=Trichinella spiralis TaxID=6334 RepID=A0A0V1AN50_TRISP|nr:hypothetical protein T01_1839 [Trichinella spiralis]